MTEQQAGLERREFIRRVAIAGGAAWAVPIVQTVAATPAYAQTLGTPRQCFKSGEGSCMEACTSVCEQAGATGSMAGEACDGVDIDPCNSLYLGQGPCQFLCPSGQGGGNPCCNDQLCDPRFFTCTKALCDDGTGPPKETAIAVYTGSLIGCPPLP